MCKGFWNFPSFAKSFGWKKSGGGPNENLIKLNYIGLRQGSGKLLFLLSCGLYLLKAEECGANPKGLVSYLVTVVYL